ncbi:hypothetical protein K440DRAFT_402230 [Wilcoxina mikolae CBS 423.85]|nr:hypothetical protein K440DRAFT_402230 [Wilcoxina mikolae CBS 423.85]
MPVPFGFSFGDFLAVAELAHAVSRALNDSLGSQQDYRTLIELLDSVHVSLRTVSTFVVSSSAATSGISPPDPLLLDGLRTHLSCCQKLMKDFLDSSKEYTNSIGRAGLTTQKKDLGDWSAVKEWKKIKWALYRAEDARNLEHRLKSHVNLFQVYMMGISL